MVSWKADKTTCSFVWGGLDPLVLEKAANVLGKCDVCLAVSWKADKTTCSLVWAGAGPTSS